MSKSSPLYLIVKSIRFATNQFLDSLSTFYYRLVCSEFGKSSIVKWGTWIQNPECIVIGENVYIGRNAQIGSDTNESYLKIANNVQINNNVLIDYTGGLEIGEKTLISDHVVIYSHSHGKNPFSTPIPIPKKIGNNCWLGIRSTILERCEVITDGAIVAAGAIVTKSLSDTGTYAGIPAKKI